MRYGWRMGLVLVVALTLTAGCTARAVDAEQYGPDEKIVIKFSHVVAAHTPKGLAARRFASLVAERTAGRVEVLVFPNAELFGDGEPEIRALLTGEVQMIAPSTAKLAEMMPQWQIFDLPYAFPDQQAVTRAMEGEVGERLFRELRRKGMLGLAMWDNGWKQMTADVELVYPVDFQGLRFRVQPSRMLAEQFRVLGATAVPLPFNETYRALETGAVDGQENTASNIFSKKFHLVQKHMTISNHGYLGYVVIANAEFWESLPPDVRTVIEECLAETTQWVRENARRLNTEDLDRIGASGSVIVHEQSEVERQAWEAALLPVYELYRREVDADLVLALEDTRR